MSVNIASQECPYTNPRHQTAACAPAPSFFAWPQLSISTPQHSSQRSHVFPCWNRRASRTRTTRGHCEGNVEKGQGGAR